MPLVCSLIQHFSRASKRLRDLSSYKIHPPNVTVDKLTLLAPKELGRNSSWVANTINFTIKVADLAKKVVPVEKGRESANLSLFGVNALR